MIEQEGSLCVREACISSDVKTKNLIEDQEELQKEFEKAKKLKTTLESHMNTLTTYLILLEKVQNEVHIRDQSKYNIRIHV